MDITSTREPDQMRSAGPLSSSQPGVGICLDTAHTGQRGKPLPITAMHTHVAHHRDLLVHTVWACDAPDTYHSAFSLQDIQSAPARAPTVLGHLTRPTAGDVTGATLCGVAQQLLCAISHLYLGVPLDCSFAVHCMDIGVPAAVSTRASINVRVRLVAVTPNVGEPHGMFDVDLLFQQEARVITVGHSKFTSAALPLERALMSRQYNPGI